jgi:uncharacterized protein YbcI
MAEQVERPREAAGGAASAVGERAQQAAAQAREAAGEAAGQARGRLRDQLDRRSTQAGERVTGTAEDLRTVGEELRKQGKGTTLAFRAVLDERSPAGELLGRISREMVGIQKQLAGKGPTKARTHWAGSDTLVVVLGGGFTTAEQTLYEGGRGNAVRDARIAFHDTVQERMKALIKAATGREVIACISGSHQNPDLVSVVFVLEPRDEEASNGSEPNVDSP